MENKIEFELLGLAEVLSRWRLRVPPNQREYSWGNGGEVRDFLQDISDAMRKGKNDPYFVGTIVLTKTSGDELEIADGQQRLATVTMILAHIRDYYRSIGDNDSANSLESEYLFKYARRAKEILPQLTLNLDDNTFFRNCVLIIPGKRESMQPTRRSHRLISSAKNDIKAHFDSLEKQYGTHFQEAIVDWEEYLKTHVKIVTLRVANSTNAFILFETLNDRGLKTSQADLVKNHLFGRAGERYEEAQSYWSRMRGAIDTIGEEDLTLDFLRLCCCLMSGATREKEIMERIERNSNNISESLKLLQFLADTSTDYAAILNSDHPKWNKYDESVRKAIRTMHLIGVTQIRPLILAISRHFKPNETARGFKRMISWSVRILIEGTRGGKLDEAYARIANKIHKGEITSDIELAKESIDLIPSDAQFKASFSVARVSVNKLARYYLRSMESTAKGEKDPEFVPNEDVVINLEHVMSHVASEAVTEQDIETHYTRIGNLALMKAQKNNDIGSLPFSQKKSAYKSSAFILTQKLADSQNWSITEIEKRQKYLAELAIKTWPVD